MSWRFSLVLAVLLICSGDGQKLRIYNGERALEGEFPFISLILASSSFSSDGSGATGQNMCGGSILSDRIILTAAHCVVRDTAVTDPATSATVDELYNPRNLEVNVGALDITQYEATAKMISPAGIIVHEDYDSVSVANDIAMIILSEDIGLAGTDKISAITLPETADRDTLYADGAAVTVIGWGTTEDGGTSDYLRKLSYTITPKASCKEHYGESILDGMMCTGTQPQKNRADTGDSGGPLFTKKNDKWVQIALVSWGPTAADMTDTSYDVNADVLYYKDWITTHKDSAFTEYVTTLSATSSTKAVVLENLRNYLYKTIKITPATAGKYTKITIKSGTMKPYDYLMIYNGDNPLTNTMLAQLTGTLEEQSYTSTTTKVLVTLPPTPRYMSNFHHQQGTCHTSTNTKVHVKLPPPPRYLSHFHHHQGTCHTSTTTKVLVTLPPPPRYLSHFHHHQGTCHTSTTTKVLVTLPPPPRYLSHLHHHQGTCHTSTTTKVLVTLPLPPRYLSHLHHHQGTCHTYPMKLGNGYVV
ncbi:hypothetical protein ACHWQZ_G013647 [Mnemiopsis leidyi]